MTPHNILWIRTSEGAVLLMVTYGRNGLELNNESEVFNPCVKVCDHESGHYFL